MIKKDAFFRNGLVLSSALALFATSAMAASFPLNGHTRSFVANAKDLGPADSTQMLNIRLWIKPPQSSGLSQAVADRMNPGSGNYHQWLSKSEELTAFKPSQSDAEQVRAYLESKGAQNIVVDANNNYVSARISVASAQSIFQVQMRKFSVRGKSVIANTSDPQLDGEIAGKVSYVGGLTSHKKRPFFSRQRDLDTGKVINAQPFAANGQMGAYESNCFRGVETHDFASTGSPAVAATATTPATPATGPVKATYTGNRFGADANATAPSLPPCGYAPATVQKVYGISDVLKAGYDGTGQTIVIVDAYGSPTIQGDALAFSTAAGLPAPNIAIYSPGGVQPTGAWNAEQQDWAGETTLDVEWAHVIAPGAKIALVEATSSSDDDLSAAIAYALDNKLGNVISNSWGGPESEEDSASMAMFDILLKTAAAQGVAINASSGDTGDYMSDGQGGGLGYLDVSYPTSAALVTGVGGTSLALNADSSIKFQVGWGNSGVRIADGVASADLAVAAQNAPLNPPAKLGFVGGSGGGTSRLVAKPGYQNKLPGTSRMVPDIAYLADPYTGVELIESSFDSNGNPQPGTLTSQVIGGTSLASPMFSAMWAIADQAHGSSLGQAAPLLYKLPSEAIVDIVPVGSSSNVTGTLTDNTGAGAVNALSLALPQTMAPFFSALYNSPNSPFRWDVITFGSDSSLQTAVGWDNVTGLGVPNGLNFIKQFIGHKNAP
jgi:subtilase family serine protease